MSLLEWFFLMIDDYNGDTIILELIVNDEKRTLTAISGNGESATLTQVDKEACDKHTFEEGSFFAWMKRNLPSTPLMIAAAIGFLSNWILTLIMMPYYIRRARKRIEEKIKS